MACEVKNGSELSVILAKAIKAEIIRESKYSEELVNIVVNHYDLEANGLARMVSEIYNNVKQIAGDN
jgi:hypothetical protein